MIDQIYLDFDNTLYNTVALSKDIERVFLLSGLNQEQFNETMKQATEGKDGQFFNYSFEHHIALCSEKGYVVASDTLQKLERTIAQDHIFIDGYEFLSWVREHAHRVYLLTAGNPDFQMKKIATTRIAEFVDDIIICHHSKQEEVATRLGTANKVVFVNDKVKENMDVQKKLPNVVVITKKHPHRETEEALLASGIPYFGTLMEIQQYLQK